MLKAQNVSMALQYTLGITVISKTIKNALQGILHYSISNLSSAHIDKDHRLIRHELRLEPFCILLDFGTVSRMPMRVFVRWCLDQLYQQYVGVKRKRINTIEQPIQPPSMRRTRDIPIMKFIITSRKYSSDNSPPSSCTLSKKKSSKSNLLDFFASFR